MVDSRYLWCLDVLKRPGHYYEKDLQESIEYLWDILFHNYSRIERSRINMPQSWRPDIVAHNRNDDIWLIIELKGRPPSGTKAQTFDQVSRYALCLLEEYPPIRLKLMVIGPWEKKYYYKVESIDNFHIMLVNTMGLGANVEKLFERMVCWCVNAPFPALRPASIVDEWIEKLPITQVGEGEEEQAPEQDEGEEGEGEKEVNYEEGE